MSTNFEEFMGNQLQHFVTWEWYDRVQVGIAFAVKKSFRDDKFKPTENEIKRRFAICMNLFCTLRREMNMSVPKILDQLHLGLRNALDGTTWEPQGEPERKCWVPGDPLNLMK